MNGIYERYLRRDISKDDLVLMAEMGCRELECSMERWKTDGYSSDDLRNVIINFTHLHIYMDELGIHWSPKEAHISKKKYLSMRDEIAEGTK